MPPSRPRVVFHSLDISAAQRNARTDGALANNGSVAVKIALEVLAQPKVSALMRGRLTDFSIERLFRFLGRLDQNVRITVSAKPPSSRKQPTLRVYAEDRFRVAAAGRR